MKPFIRKDQFSPHVDITAAYAAIEAIEAIETIEAIEAIEAIERALEDELRALETLGNGIGTAADEPGALDAWSGSTTQPTRALGPAFRRRAIGVYEPPNTPPRHPHCWRRRCA